MLRTFLIGGLCLLVTACQPSTQEEERKTVRTIQVTSVTTTLDKEYPARLRALQKVDVRNKIRAYIDQVLVEEGAEVKEGQLLFVLSSKLLEEQVSKARALRTAALAELNAAELEVSNAQKLFREQVIGQSELVLYEKKAEVMRAKADDATLSLKQAEIERSYCKISAPFSGRVNRIPFREGSLIEEGTSLTSLTNGQTMFAYFYIPEKLYFQWIKQYGKAPDLPVRFKLSDGQMLDYPGKVDVLESEVNPETGTVGVRARLTNTENMLLHGTSLAIVISDTLRNVYAIPYSGLVERQGRHFVYAVNSQSLLERVEVQLLGLKNDQAIVAQTPRIASVSIVSEGAAFLREGEKVKAIQSTNQSATR